MVRKRDDGNQGSTFRTTAAAAAARSSHRHPAHVTRHAPPGAGDEGRGTRQSAPTVRAKAKATATVALATWTISFSAIES